LGWKTFSSGVITVFDKAVDIGTPVIKDLTQEAREYVNSPEQLRPTYLFLVDFLITFPIFYE